MGFLDGIIKFDSGAARGIYNLENLTHAYLHEHLNGTITVMVRADDKTAIEVYRTECVNTANDIKTLLQELIDYTK